MSLQDAQMVPVMVISVRHEVSIERWAVAMEMWGDERGPRFGSLIGWSGFMIFKFLKLRELTRREAWSSCYGVVIFCVREPGVWIADVASVFFIGIKEMVEASGYVDFDYIELTVVWANGESWKFLGLSGE